MPILNPNNTKFAKKRYMRIIIFSLLTLVAFTASASPDYYLAGEFNGWTPNQQAYKFQEDGDIYTLTVSELKGEFKITTPYWEHQYGAGKALVAGETYKCTESGNGFNMTIADPSARNITLVFDDSNKTVCLLPEISLYLVGDFNNWQKLPAYRFMESGDLYVLRTHDFSGAFKVVTESDDLSLGSADIDALGENEERYMAPGGDAFSFAGLATPGKTIKITLNPSGNISPSAIRLPEAQEEKEEFFTLQGIPVSNPGPGIYIRRIGSKTEKIVRTP